MNLASGWDRRGAWGWSRARLWVLCDAEADSQRPWRHDKTAEATTRFVLRCHVWSSDVRNVLSITLGRWTPELPAVRVRIVPHASIMPRAITPTKAGSTPSDLKLTHYPAPDPITG